MLYALMGYVHAAVEGRVRAIRSLVAAERGQGTVEYVGLILLVSLLMVGMVAAMKGFNRSFSKGGYYNSRGTEQPGRAGGPHRDTNMIVSTPTRQIAAPMGRPITARCLHAKAAVSGAAAGVEPVVA